MAEKTPLPGAAKARSDPKSGGDRKSRVVELVTSVPTPASSVKQEVQEQEPQEVPAPDISQKVFVGNLPYDATQEQLEELFKDAGEIVEVTIAATQRRPMGFGFVTFKTPESAKKAIEDYNLIEFNNRKIAVEQAMDKSSLYRSGYRPRRGRGKGRGSRYGGSYPSRRGGVSSRDGRYHGSLARIDGNQPSSDDANEDANAEDQTSADRNISGTASQLGDEIPQSHQDASDSAFGGIDDVTGGAQHGDQDEEYQEGQYPQSHTGRNRSRPPRGRGRGRGRGARGRGGSRRDYDNGSYSATTLFITNLPYDVLEPELSELFEDYKVSKISVMKFKDDTSKGYGFVELETHDEQQRVLSELQEVVIGQRSIVIKPAFPHPRYGNKQQRQSNGEVDIKSSEDEEEEEEQHNKPPQPSQPRDSKNP